jgi:hypothetical protein
MLVSLISVYSRIILGKCRENKLDKDTMASSISKKSMQSEEVFNASEIAPKQSGCKKAEYR